MQNITIKFYYISLLAFLCGGLLTFLVKGTPLVIWRQLITLVGFMIFLFSSSFFLLTECNREKKKLFNMSLLCIVYWGIGICFQGFSVYRTSYALWGYISSFHMIFFPVLLAKSSNFNPRSLFNFFSFIGLFFSLGLIVDSQTIYFKILNLQSNESLAYLTDEGIEESRCAFLADAVSTFGIYIAFCVVSAIYLLCNTKSISKQWYYIFCIMVAIVGTWFSGSRQIFFIVAFIGIYGLTFFFLRVQRSKLQCSIMLILLVVCFSYVVIPLVIENESMRERYLSGTDNVSDNVRQEQWLKGCRFFIDDFTRFLGSGIGTISSQGARPGELFVSHFENSFLSRMIEMGVLGIWVLLYPIISICQKIRLRKRDLLDRLILLWIGGFVFTGMVSPNAMHYTAQCIAYLIVGIYIIRDKYTLSMS